MVPRDPKLLFGLAGPEIEEAEIDAYVKILLLAWKVNVTVSRAYWSK
jgi:hypothetical protein